MRRLDTGTRWEGAIRMPLENLVINRIAFHDIFRRNEQRKVVTPRVATEIEEISPKARDEICSRVVRALSAQSKGVELQIVKHGDDDLVTIAELIIAADDQSFLALVGRVSHLLAEAQTTQLIPGGVLVTFDGSAGNPPKPVFGVIKAELQSAFNRRERANENTTEFLDRIFLSPAQKLFKIGLFIRVDPSKMRPEGWKAFVFDNNISAANRENAALYFYETFLGCNFGEDAAYETRRLFDLTKDYIQITGRTREQKTELVSGLHTYVKTEVSPTISADEFAQRFFTSAEKDSYSDFLTSHRFPDRAIQRDTSEMGRRGQRRRFKFGKEIELAASPDAISDGRVAIRARPAHELGGQGDDPWTEIIVRQSVTEEK